MTEKSIIGIIGTGHLIRHMMPAMINTGHRFIVSRRNQETSAHLAKRYGVEISDDNQGIIDQSSIVILAVRPYDALDVATALNFQGTHTVLSVCAGVEFDDLTAAVSPAKLVAAMPVVAAEFAESPTLLYPENAACRALLQSCGPVLALENERDFAPASAAACYYGWVHELIGEMAQWLEQKQIRSDITRVLAAQMTRAAATAVIERQDASISELTDELASPRSFTLKGLQVLREHDAFSAWHRAADALVDVGK